MSVNNRIPNPGKRKAFNHIDMSCHARSKVIAFSVGEWEQQVLLLKFISSPSYCFNLHIV
jgi:hypothetical protein